MINEEKEKLIENLLRNRISQTDFARLREEVTAMDLSYIIQHIYDLNESYILRLSRVEKAVDFLNRMKNDTRRRVFFGKINNGFRLKSAKNKVVLVEGDSWFNYPVMLTDLIDRIGMEENIALYSIAGGGDWLLNMLSVRQYVEELSVIHPDAFLISGGGNDLVGSRRLAAMVNPLGNSNEFLENEWAMGLIGSALGSRERQRYTPLDDGEFKVGCSFLNKDFFALLMFFQLQYSFMIRNILGREGKSGKFDPIRIVTQGYDYAVPSLNKGWGLKLMNWYIPVIRNFLGHGDWLKTPLNLRGVPDDQDQHRKIVYAMIYLFNEMMIELPKVLKKPVYHIDSRGLMSRDGWADELHPKPYKALQIGETFVKCINEETPTYDSIYVVKSRL